MLCFFLNIGLTLAQTSVVTGEVTDNEGNPIAGASVTVKGTSMVTATDDNGKFSIGNVPASAKTVSVSFIGMENKEVPIAPGTMRISLTPRAELLDEVIVTAMGISRQEKTLGYSATMVKGDDIADAHTTNVLDALAGKVAGVQIFSTSPDPGAITDVFIRGLSSINYNNQPIYVIDGVPLQNNYIPANGLNSSLSGITNVSANDIESMTILKGAAATALYGSRASNGVIVITTKKGSKGENNRNFSITYDGSFQARRVSVLPEMQNAFGMGNNGKQTFNENFSWGPALDGSMQVYGPEWNHQQLLHAYSAKENNVKDFFDTGWSHNHNVALSGISGDEKMTYYFSYSFAGDDGIVPDNHDSYKRNTLAFRNSYAPVRWLKLTTSVNFARTATDAVPSYQGISMIDGLYQMPRDVSIVDLKDLSSPFNTPEAYFTPWSVTNPYWALENNYDHTSAKQIYGHVRLDIKPIDDLTLSYRMGIDYSDYDYKVGKPEITLDDALIGNDYGTPPSHVNRAGSVAVRYGRLHEINHDFLVNYARKFVDDKLDLDINIGVNINERASMYMNGQTNDLAINTGFWDLSNGATRTALSENQRKRRAVGLFGDVVLGWDDMLYLELSARNDWSSTLPLGNNSFFYPGATLSWIFTRLIPKNDILSFGKLRLAYGKTGNDAPEYQTAISYTPASASGLTFPLDGINAFMRDSELGSPNLQPEMTTEGEIGLNLQFARGRIGIDAAFYNRLTDNQIFSLPVDPAVGYSTVVTNFGTVRNRGIELLANFVPVQTKNFRWELSLNFTKNYNKVLSLPENLENSKININYQRISTGKEIYLYAEKGKPIGEFYTQQTQRDDQGRIIVDKNGTPLKSTELEDTGKNMNYDWTGGITTALSFKGITLRAALDVRKGGYMYSRTKYMMYFTGNSVLTTYNDRRPFIIPNSVVANDDGTYSENTTPIYLSNGSYRSYFDQVEAWLIDRSFVKLRNLSLTWDLPKKWVRTMQLSGIALTLFCNNVFTWTAADNLYIDPEAADASGKDVARLFGERSTNPACRTFGANLSIKF